MEERICIKGGGKILLIFVLMIPYSDNNTKLSHTYSYQIGLGNDASKTCEYKVGNI